MRTTLYRSKLIIDVYEGWIHERSRVLDVGCVTAVVSSQVEPNFTTFILDVLTNFLHYGHFGLPWCARKAVYWSEYFKGLDLFIFRKLGDIIDGYYLKKCLPYKMGIIDNLKTIFYYFSRYRRESN